MIEVWSVIESSGRINNPPRLINKVDSRDEADLIIKQLQKSGCKGGFWIDTEAPKGYSKVYRTFGSWIWARAWLFDRLEVNASNELVK